MSVRLFDLNVEEFLDNWEVHHALREVIANALDEQVLTQSADVRIFKAGGDWRIRDYGRGLRIEHFTLKENKEKLARPYDVIGKFGVGLKDALATLHRRGVEVWICSQYGVFHVRTARKHDFDQIYTLHVEYDDTPQSIAGTEVVLRGVADVDIMHAKSYFLRFRGEEVMDSTPLGQILRRGDNTANVYITGVLASEESGFLFSYNITSLTQSMRKQLNRERIHVGRSVYTERVKALLKAATSTDVRNLLADQLLQRSRGMPCDELQWIEISQLAINILHGLRPVGFATQGELQCQPHVVDNMQRDGYEVLVITEEEKRRLDDQVQTGGPLVRTVEGYVKEYNESFQYSFVPADRLTPQEKEILHQMLALLRIAGVTQIPQVRISETLRLSPDGTNGVWDPELEAIVIKRTTLRSLESFARVLLHEAAHASTGTVDATREFEEVLTQYLGRAACTGIRVMPHRPTPT